MLAGMVEEKDIEPHAALWDKTERKNDSFSSSDFHRKKRPRNTAVQPATYCAANDEPSSTNVRTSPKPTPSSSDSGRPTALPVR
jgi:hypothetical protein